MLKKIESKLQQFYIFLLLHRGYFKGGLIFLVFAGLAFADGKDNLGLVSLGITALCLITWAFVDEYYKIKTTNKLGKSKGSYPNPAGSDESEAGVINKIKEAWNK